MNQFLKVATVYEDLPNFIEVNIRVNNGYFSGTTELFTHPDELDDLAKILKGFPSGKDDVREFELGTFKSGYAGGGLHLKFRCVDSLGHVVIETTLKADEKMTNGQSVYLVIACVAADIDNFIHQLMKMDNNAFSSAELISSYNHNNSCLGKSFHG